MPPKHGGRGGGRGGEPLPRSVQVSKKLSRLLRHAAEEEGIHLDSAGYAIVADVLNNRLLRSFKVSLSELMELVKDNDKQRFSIIPASPNVTANDPNENMWLIRANQGHSLKVESEGLLTPITAESIPEVAVHGTTHAAWLLIVASGGLKAMARNHVHFASGLPAGFKSIVDSTNAGMAADDAAAPVISGMRKSSTVLMFLDVGKAMESGLKLWTSDNGVILTEGNAEGLVLLELFRRVEDRTGEGVLLQDGKIVKEAPATWAGRGKSNG